MFGCQFFFHIFFSFQNVKSTILMLSKKLKKRFFWKNNKKFFFVNELNINPEVEVSKSKTMVRVTWHTYTYIVHSENRNHYTKFRLGVFWCLAVIDFQPVQIRDQNSNFCLVLWTVIDRLKWFSDTYISNVVPPTLFICTLTFIQPLASDWWFCKQTHIKV